MGGVFALLYFPQELRVIEQQYPALYYYKIRFMLIELFKSPLGITGNRNVIACFREYHLNGIPPRNIVIDYQYFGRCAPLHAKTLSQPSIHCHRSLFI